jgi:hypothetical protein
LTIIQHFNIFLATKSLVFAICKFQSFFGGQKIFF